jgi:F420-non-reducing hydrogenase large subunit
MIGGRKVHPCTSIPRRHHQGHHEEQRKQIEEMGRWAIDFAQFSLQAVQRHRAGQQTVPRPDPRRCLHPQTYYMGMVDENNKVNFYDGKVRVVDPNGKEFVQV